MQLKPIRGDYIFEQPKYGNLKDVFEVFNLWEKFMCVVLEQNHRQGEDREYADLLGRIRFKELDEMLSDADHALLKSRCLLPDDEESTLQIFCKNASVNLVNEKRLNLLDSKMYTIEALHIPSTRDSLLANTSPESRGQDYAHTQCKHSGWTNQWGTGQSDGDPSQE